MTRRFLTAVPLAALVIWLILQPHEWPFVLALLITIELALREFFVVACGAGMRTYRWLGYIGAGALCLAQVAAIQSGKPTVAYVFLAIVVILPMAGLILRPGSSENAPVATNVLSASSATLFGITYVAFSLSWLIPMRFSDPETGRMLTIMLFLLIWSSDISAYLVGRKLGRTFPFPRISPRKTVEGSVAGIIGAAVAGGLYARLYWKAGSWAAVIVLAIIVGVASQAGDLIESAMKREANLKDSGKLLPGHGGMLDRIDSLLLAAPILWILWEFRRIWGI